MLVAALAAGTGYGSQGQSQPSASSGTEAQSAANQPAPPHSKHSVIVKFDYDFGRTPACSPKITQKCVQQFVAYDISGGSTHRTKLFAIPLPPHADGLVHGITATSPQLNWESGKHLLSVVAQYPDGTESQQSACTTWVTVP